MASKNIGIPLPAFRIISIPPSQNPFKTFWEPLQNPHQRFDTQLFSAFIFTLWWYFKLEMFMKVQVFSIWKKNKFICRIVGFERTTYNFSLDSLVY